MNLQRSLGTLKRFAKAAAASRCELCALELTPRHLHLFDPKASTLLCSCQGCYLLFDDGDRTRYRRVPRDVRRVAEPNQGDWEKLGVPIGLAFIYRKSAAALTVGAYPSPAGLTESPVDEAAWEALRTARPELRSIRDDVEALLVSRLRGQSHAFISPIDRCFELAAVVRKHWLGINGGDRVREEIERALDTLAQEARS